MSIPNKRATLKTIAKATGFSINTVSLSLRDSPLVTSETRKIIKEEAQKQGYIFNALAGSLRSGHSYTVAFILGDVANLLFAIKIKEIDKAFRKHGYQALILSTDEDPKQELEVVKAALQRNLDGVILCPCQKDSAALDLLKRYHMPHVLIGRHFGSTQMDSVVWDDRKGGYLATKHLIEKGCKNILLLNAPSYISSARERYLGYCDALEQSNIALQDSLVREVEPMAGHVNAAFSDVFSEGLVFDGVFAFNDLLAWETAYWLEERGVDIPSQVKLVGYDDIQSHIAMPYPLSTVAAAKDEEAEHVAKLLIHKMEKPSHTKCQQIVMDTHLVIRKSSGN